MKKKLVHLIKQIQVVNNPDDENALLNKITDFRGVKVISFVNAHAINLCRHQNNFTDALSTSDYLLRDGVGMKLLFKQLQIEPGRNMNGTDFIPKLLKSTKGKKIFLIGTQEPYLSKAAKKLEEEGHTLVGTADGFQPERFYIERITNTTPDIIILGMGMPKQELISIQLKEKLTSDCLIINGGAIIDFYGGKVSRAPFWMQRNGLEWFYRFLQEPRRMYKRYLVGNFTFLIHTTSLKNSYKAHEAYR